MKKGILFFLALFLFIADIGCFAAGIVIDGEASNSEWSAAESLDFSPSKDNNTSIDTLFIKFLVDKKDKTVYLRFSAQDSSGKEASPYLKVNSKEFNICSNLEYNDFFIEYARIHSNDKSYTNAELAIRFKDSITSNTKISIAFIDGNGNWSNYYTVWGEAPTTVQSQSQSQSQAKTETKNETEKTVTGRETKAAAEKTTDSTKKNSVISRTDSVETETYADTAKNTNNQSHNDKTNENRDKPAVDNEVTTDNEAVAEETMNRSEDGYKNEKAVEDVKKGYKYIALMLLLAAVFAAFCVEIAARLKSQTAQSEHIEAETKNDENETD